MPERSDQIQVSDLGSAEQQPQSRALPGPVRIPGPVRPLIPTRRAAGEAAPGKRQKQESSAAGKDEVVRHSALQPAFGTDDDFFMDADSAEPSKLPAAVEVLLK